jgi:hypothetical protein
MSCDLAVDVKTNFFLSVVCRSLSGALPRPTNVPVFQRIFGVHIDPLKAVRGGFFTMESPPERMPSVNGNAESAIGGVKQNRSRNYDR